MSLKNILLVVGMICCGSLVAETDIYFESFSGPAGEKLNKKCPDKAPEGVRWESSARGSLWMADGSIETQSVNQNRNAFLPFKPDAGKLYALSLDMNPKKITGKDAFALGFSSNNSLAESYVSNAEMAVSPWIMVTETRTVRTYCGPGNAGNVAAPAPRDGWGEWVSAKIILDTRSDPWAIEWFVNGTSVRSHKFYTGNPEINYVTFSRLRRAAGAVDNFKLSVISN